MAINILDAQIKQEGTPSIYLLPPTTKTIISKPQKIRSYEIGVLLSTLEEKVFMVVGGSGAGKTTLIQFLLNYVLDVQWNDNFRYHFEVDDEEKVLQRRQTKSQTQWITSYTINYKVKHNFPYRITIVDTPGVNDTDHKKTDKVIAKQIQTYFTSRRDCELVSIDAVIFVMKATDNRLTDNQKAVFNSVLGLFGKNISQNIFLFLTHANMMEEPPVLQAVHESDLPYAHSYNFDNAYAFQSTEHGTLDERKQKLLLTLKESTWKMGTESLDKFLRDLKSTSRKSIHLTTEVLEERETLELILDGIPQLITTQIVTFNKLKEEEKVLEKHQNEMSQSENFSYSVQEENVITKTLEDDERAMNCKRCKRTCHYPCTHELANLVNTCSAMKWMSFFRGCSVCGTNCRVSDHEKMNVRYHREIKTVVRTHDELKERYEVAKDSMMKSKDLLEPIRRDMFQAEEKVKDYIEQIRDCLNRLREIALLPDSSSVLDYINSLISAERLKAQPGWMERVCELQKLHQREELRQKESSDSGDSSVAKLVRKTRLMNN